MLTVYKLRRSDQTRSPTRNNQPSLRRAFIYRLSPGEGALPSEPHLRVLSSDWYNQSLLDKDVSRRHKNMAIVPKPVKRACNYPRIRSAKLQERYN